MPDLIKLNEFGKAVWRHKRSRTLFVERSYEWCDRVIMLDEQETRRIVDDTRFSTFDFSDWIPMTVAEYATVKQNYKDIYNDPAIIH